MSNPSEKEKQQVKELARLLMIAHGASIGPVLGLSLDEVRQSMREGADLDAYWKGVQIGQTAAMKAVEGEDHN